MIKTLPNYKDKNGKYNWEIFEKMFYYDPETKQTVLPKEDYNEADDSYWDEYIKEKGKK